MRPAGQRNRYYLCCNAEVPFGVVDIQECEKCEEKRRIEHTHNVAEQLAMIEKPKRKGRPKGSKNKK